MSLMFVDNEQLDYSQKPVICEAIMRNVEYVFGMDHQQEGGTKEVETVFVEKDQKEKVKIKIMGHFLKTKSMKMVI